MPAANARYNKDTRLVHSDRHMKYFAIALALVLLPLSSQAFTLQEWRTWQLATPPFLSQVERSHWLDDSKTRIHASGQLMFTSRDSLLWHWQTPLPRMVKVDIAGQLFELVSSAGEPVLALPNLQEDNLPDERQIARLLLHAVQGDHAALKRDYHLLLSGTPAQWRLTLVPRGEAQGQQAADGNEHGEIHIAGGRFINVIQATAPQGNVLKLQLLGQRRLVDAEGALNLQALLRGDKATQQDETRLAIDGPGPAG